MWVFAAVMSQFTLQLIRCDSSEGSGTVPDYESGGFLFVGAYLNAAEAC